MCNWYNLSMLGRLNVSGTDSPTHRLEGRAMTMVNQRFVTDERHTGWKTDCDTVKFKLQLHSAPDYIYPTSLCAIMNQTDCKGGRTDSKPFLGGDGGVERVGEAAYVYGMVTIVRWMLL